MDQITVQWRETDGNKERNEQMGKVLSISDKGHDGNKRGTESEQGVGTLWPLGHIWPLTCCK